MWKPPFKLGCIFGFLTSIQIHTYIHIYIRGLERPQNARVLERPENMQPNSGKKTATEMSGFYRYTKLVTLKFDVNHENAT